jgi:hypothetical protein
MFLLTKARQIPDVQGEASMNFSRFKDARNILDNMNPRVVI